MLILGKLGNKSPGQYFWIFPIVTTLLPSHANYVLLLSPVCRVSVEEFLIPALDL